MTQIEQFKVELKRRIELYENPLGVADVRLQDERKGMLKALSDMLTFIDSLPAESPYFEAEWKRYTASLRDDMRTNAVTMNVKEVAKHFYNLALEDVKKECERRRKLSTKNHDESSTKDVKLLYGGHIGAYTHIIDFIDNQKSK